MKQYKVLCNCWGFMGRYWMEGKIVDLPDNVNPPHHFELIGTKEDPIPEPQKEVAQEKPELKRDIMRPKLATPGKPIKPEGGFAGRLNLDNPSEVLTASQVYKRGRQKVEK